MAPQRKLGERWPNGKLKQPSREQREYYQKRLDEQEKATVLSQPHRRGDTHQWRESVFGSWLLDNGLQNRGELYDAGIAYASLSKKISSIWGGPKIENVSGNGGDVPSELSLKWKQEKLSLESVAKRAGNHLGLVGIEQLTIDHTLTRVDRTLIILALNAMAIELGLIKPTTNGG